MKISLVKNININTAFRDHTDKLTIYYRLRKSIKRKKLFLSVNVILNPLLEK